MDARPYCYRCDKPLGLCVCRHLQPIANRTHVVVLQHAREQRHALGTARLLRLGLSSVDVHVLKQNGTSASVAPIDLPLRSALLYPSPEADDLHELHPHQHPEHLVVIDGTWSHAHRIYRDNPWISALPKVRLSPETGSRYRIRKEPRLECLSTVESVVAALRCIEPDLEGTETLDAAFDAMINEQIAARVPGSRPRHKRPRRAPPQPIPEAMRAADTRMIVVYAEAEPMPPGYDGPRGPGRLSAVDLASGAVFDRMIRTTHTADAYVLALLGISESALEHAESLDQVLQAFTEFCGSGPAPVLATWNRWTHGWLVGRQDAAPVVMLKAVWANVTQERIPSLEQVVQTYDLPAPPLDLPGRAGVRLTHARAVAQRLMERAHAG